MSGEIDPSLSPGFNELEDKLESIMDMDQADQVESSTTVTPKDSKAPSPVNSTNGDVKPKSEADLPPESPAAEEGEKEQPRRTETEVLMNLLRESEEKHRLAQMEWSRRENLLLVRLMNKDHEMQEVMGQLNELKASIAPNQGALRSVLLDPAVNWMIQRMRKELEDSKKKLEDTQNDLNAWKFTPDSNTGKRLMAKCKMLYQENDELGKLISSGRTAKLESDLALQKSLSEEMKKSQSELDELVQELDEDVDGMQSTIYFLQKMQEKSGIKDTNGDENVIDNSTATPPSKDPTPGGGETNNVEMRETEQEESKAVTESDPERTPDLCDPCS